MKELNQSSQDVVWKTPLVQLLLCMRQDTWASDAKVKGIPLSMKELMDGMDSK